MPELSATALFGIVLTGLFFSLGTTTVYQANNPIKLASSSMSSGATTTTTTTTAANKDYPNIVFGSLFLLFAVLLAIFTFRAIFLSP